MEWTMEYTALPAIKATFLRSDRVGKGQKNLEHSVKGPHLLYTKIP